MQNKTKVGVALLGIHCTFKCTNNILIAIALHSRGKKLGPNIGKVKKATKNREK